MSEFFSFLQYNPFVNFILSCITIASIIYAIYTNRINKKYKYLEHYEISRTLFYPSNRKRNLHLFYEEQEIPNVTITNVAVWNAGNEALRYSDLANSLDIIFDEDEQDIKDENFYNTILSASIIGATNQNNAFAITKQSDKIVSLEFKFLNAGDGAVIQLLHTGYPFNLKISANVIGENIKKKRTVKKRRHRMESRAYDSFRSMLRRLTLLATIITTALFGFWMVARMWFPSILGDDWTDIKVTTFFLACTVIIVWVYYIITKYYDYYDYVPEKIKQLLNK